MSTEATPKTILTVNGIEVIYNHVILVLKGVSLTVPEGGIVAILGGNGAGKTTTLRAVSNLLKGERGEVTKGSIDYRGERIENLSPAELVKRGVVQVMEGRHCFAHLTIEENLLTGAYTRKDKGEIAANLDKVYTYFPRLKTRRTSQAAYTSGGEQQMCAIGRALMCNPTMVLLDEPSMGLAPQIVDEVFHIVKDLNGKERTTFLLALYPSLLITLTPGYFWYLSLHPKGPGRVHIRFGGGMSDDYRGDADAQANFAALKELLDRVNVEDRGCTEKVYRGLCADLSAPGHLSHLERPNYDFARYLAGRVAGVKA